MSARDFVYGFKTGKKNETFSMGGISVEVADKSEQKRCVRGVHCPGCQMVQPVEGESGKSI